MSGKKEPVPMTEEEMAAYETKMGKAAEALSRAKVQLLLHQPFFGVFLANSIICLEKMPEIGTMATDGLKIYADPDFVLSLNTKELIGLLMHEISHMVYMHCTKKRRGNRAPRRYNMAADYVINWEIDAIANTDKILILPKQIPVNGKNCGILLDQQYREMTAEQVYEKLPENPKGDTWDVHLDMPSDAGIEEVEDRIMQTYEATKSKGSLPAGMERQIKALKNSKVPWQRLFARAIGTALSNEDYSYTKPNRRYLAQDIIVPGLFSLKVGQVAIAVDTSGSIGEKELQEFITELRKISELISEVIVMSCDAAVHTFEVIRDLANFDKAVRLKGGGGTSFVPPFEMLKKKRIEPEVFIYLTDGYGDFPAKKPNYPVLWIMTTDVQAPWGNTIHMPKDEEGGRRR